MITKFVKWEQSCLMPTDGRMDSRDQTNIHVFEISEASNIQGGSNMTGTDLYVNKPHCAAAVRTWEREATTSILLSASG